MRMRQIIKSNDSQILVNQFQYPKDRKKIASCLKAEQFEFCAYTDDRITATFSTNIDHFNPSLKNTIQDGYENWFLISSRFNLKKSTKWEDFQPVLSPADQTLEARMIYFDGFYFPQFADDTEVLNLIKLLDLNNHHLVKMRTDYLNELSVCFNNDIKKMENHLLKFPMRIQFPRAIYEVFNLKFY